jgi:aminoglycoside phosphotransferase (APT) family kinase protein
VPKIIAICADERVIGAEFFVMERISGIIPRKDLPEGLLLDAAQTRTLCLNVLDRLVDLHQIDPRTAGLSDLGKGDGYVARQVSGWSDRFRRARTADVGDFESVMAWLADKQPTHDAASRVIHNDYRFDNVVLDPADPLRVIGVLDWEMCTIGDPLMDLGNSLAYWVEAGDDAVRQMTRRQPTHLPGMLTRSEVIAYYADKTGLPVDNVDFYATFGLFRLAGIVQQIYYRYYHKQTDNPAFAGFGDIVRYLEGACLKAIG